jgi:antitoxin (DNA-binding transcriptional repressor) of toxin-antitoxin stability system
MAKTIDMEEAGASLPDQIERAVTDGHSVVLCRGGRPVAVAMSPEPAADEVGPPVHPESLAALAGKWEGFEEIEPFIDEAYRARQTEVTRDISLDE